jgi:Flp pilus assembly protein TadB
VPASVEFEARMERARAKEQASQTRAVLLAILIYAILGAALWFILGGGTSGLISFVVLVNLLLLFIAWQQMKSIARSRNPKGLA